MKARSLILSLALSATVASAQDAPPFAPGERVYSAYPAQDFPNQVLFGDTHLHTSYSWDAGMIGNSLGPKEAYLFAKGETVTSSTGQPARLKRPLDWLVVADHAEGLGVAPMLVRADPALLSDPFGAELHTLFEPQTPAAIGEAYNFFVRAKGAGKNPLTTDQEIPKGPWVET